MLNNDSICFPKTDCFYFIPRNHMHTHTHTHNEEVNIYTWNLSRGTAPYFDFL